MPNKFNNAAVRIRNDAAAFRQESRTQREESAQSSHAAGAFKSALFVVRIFETEGGD